MLPSPQTNEVLLAPTSFQGDGAELQTIGAAVFWRKHHRRRLDADVAPSDRIALVGLCAVVGKSVFALLDLPAFLFPMTAGCTKSHMRL